ncbi:actin-related protein [Panaeolus papilionaceus]|nr:actin-related protein [Panaeolus papilionaceus]
MSLRDANIIIIEVSRTAVRAGLGLFDLLKTPSVDIPARVGLRRSSLHENGNSDGLASTSASTSRATSLFPQSSHPSAAVKDYLVGNQLDEALADGQDIIVSWPFADGDVSDWTQAEAIWKFILFQALQRRRVQNESPVILSMPSESTNRNSAERICQVFFERFNVPGFALLERPIAHLYAASTQGLSGVIVDIGDEVTDITPIYDGFIQHHAKGSVQVGMRHCEEYLVGLLKQNTSVRNALAPPGSDVSPEQLHQTLLDLVKQLWNEDTIKIPSDGETAVLEDEGVTDIAAVVVAGREKAVIESGMKKKLTAKASAAEQARAREIEALDLITVEFKGHSLTLGKERHRFCEPLFDPSLCLGQPSTISAKVQVDKPRPIQEIVGHCVGQTDVDYRQYIWQGLIVTGTITRHVKGIGVALQSRLSPFIGNPDLQSDVQARLIRVLNVPDYYAEYRETGNGYSAFLGSSITAKIVFSQDPNSKNFVSKSDYTSRGPHAIIEMTPALL